MTSCEITRASRTKIVGGCMVEAVAFQDAIIADNELSKNPKRWSRLLIAEYYKNNKLVCHVMVIYNDNNGNFYAYDKRGSFDIKKETVYNPLLVAKQVIPFVTMAMYLDKIYSEQQ